MHTDMEARACDLAEYLLANNTTVRAAAKQFGVSKSTVHKDLTERLARGLPDGRPRCAYFSPKRKRYRRR